jgi:hypothetical protein
LQFAAAWRRSASEACGLIKNAALEISDRERPRFCGEVSRLVFTAAGFATARMHASLGQRELTI